MGKVNSMDNLRIFDAGRNNNLSRKVCDILGLKLSDAERVQFNDGDVTWKIDETLRGTDVYVFQSYVRSADGRVHVGDRLYELALLMNGIRSGGASKINVVMPFMFGSRAERRTKPKEPINTVVIAKTLKAMGADSILTVNIHTRSIGSSYDCLDMLFDNLEFEPLIADYFAQQHSHTDNDFAVCSPDAGGVERARYLLEILRDYLRFNVGEDNLCVVNKYRSKHNHSEIFGVTGEVQGKEVIIIDDIGDTLGTIISCSYALKEKGAKKIFLAYPHGVHSKGASDKLLNSLEEKVVDGVVLSDSIPLDERLVKHPQIRIYSLAPLIAEGIRQIHTNGSVSPLHKYHPVIELYKKTN